MHTNQEERKVSENSLSLYIKELERTKPKVKQTEEHKYQRRNK